MRWDLRSRLLALVGVAVIVAVVLLPLKVLGLLGRQGGLEEARLVETGPPAGVGGYSVGPERGQFAPDFEAPTLEGGQKVRLSDFRGRPVYLNFWATWCGPCERELPDIARLRRSHPDLVVIGINRAEPPERALRFLKNLGLSGSSSPFTASVADPTDVLFPAYRGIGMPFSVFLNRQGRVVAVYNGLLPLEKMEEMYRLAAETD
ncbi:MAG: TlpA disulfide reductase family protein [Dehalococcoidia bacterium]|nr:TlpA disulfide reductase family protein [Dehalococcoidia bacterium]